MNTLSLVLSEIRFRLVNFVLCVVAVAIAAALFVAGPTVISGYSRHARAELATMQDEADRMQKDADQLRVATEQMSQETEKMQQQVKQELAQMDKKTRRIMRDLGVNLRIVHKDTNMSSLYTDFVAKDFPEHYVNELAKAEQIETIVHLVATLQHKLKWNRRTILLTGVKPVLTRSQKNEEKPHMVKQVPPGTVLVGHELGAGLEVGKTLDIQGHVFRISKIMPELGGLEDVQLVVNLEDAQRVLKRPEKINQIMALNCKCKGDRISIVRKELEGVLPDTKVNEFKSRASAREKQRDLVAAVKKKQIAAAQANVDRSQANYLAVKANHTRAEENYQRQVRRKTRQESRLKALATTIIPLVILVSALFVGLMSWLNVRERRAEIGVLRALGKRGLHVAGLFLAKAELIGMAGGLCGIALGYLASMFVGQQLEIAVELFHPQLMLLSIAVIGAPMIAVLASYLPMLSALKQDPAVVLMDS